MSKAELKIPE